MSDQRPIGIFDSGIGGLTVARSINQLMPNEQLIYFGDTAHFPYGDKERTSIQHYSKDITRFLLQENCKAIVIACNTASAASATLIKKDISRSTPLFDVITPVVDFVTGSFNGKKIGVIATKGTTNSRIYPKLIKQADPSIVVHTSATPLLAPMIEEGFFNNQISKSIIASYLSKNNLKGIDALVLGCTHYPIIEVEVQAYYQKLQQKTQIINSAEIVADYVKQILEAKDLLSTNLINEHQFYVSDWTTAFEKSSEIFFGKAIKLKKKALWK